MKLSDMCSVTLSMLCNINITTLTENYTNENASKVRSIKYSLDVIRDKESTPVVDKVLYFVDFKDVYDSLVLSVNSCTNNEANVTLYAVSKDDVMYGCNVAIELSDEVLTDDDKEFLGKSLKMFICTSLFENDKTICSEVIDNLFK